MKLLIIVFAIAVAIAIAGLLLEATVFGGAWVMHQRELYDDEIVWLEKFTPVMGWEKGLERLILKRYGDRVERALLADRIDRAVHLFSEARAAAHRVGGPMDTEIVRLGIETFRRAADRLTKYGRFSDAADWDDSLFVLAVRAHDPHQRYEALSGLLAGLDLRVKDGKPCAALARVRWAKQGLGGAVPGMADNVEEDLAQQCRQAQRDGR
ncbi:MAG: hypothetical protein HYR74_02450 [Candidatus Eisenbacteria bacterium]|nr:hypothetical protein [Candidatus Eisenbacteria bacterium]